MILAFSILPLLLSAYLALSRFQLGLGGYHIRFVGLANFTKLLFGTEQYHFLGVFAPIAWQGWLLLAVVVLLLAVAISHYVRRGKLALAGLIGPGNFPSLILALRLLTAPTPAAGGDVCALTLTP